MKLYKYKSLPYRKDKLSKEEQKQIEYCKDILLNNRLFMAPRESLNDPFEGMAYPIHLGICGAGSWGALGLPHPIVMDYMNRYRVLSLSSDPKSPVMWAHYANNYCGVCFEFEMDILPKKIQRVSYIEHQNDIIFDPNEETFYKAIESSLLCKSQNWAYEKEYRVISKTDEEYFEFKESELTGIIIGHRSVYANELIELANEKRIPVFYTLTSTQNYDINIINKLPNDLIIGEDTIDYIQYR